MDNNITKKSRSNKEKQLVTNTSSLKAILLNEEENLLQAVKQFGYETITTFANAKPDHQKLEQDELSQFIDLQDKCREHLNKKEHLESTIIIDPAKIPDTVNAVEKILIKNCLKHNTYQRSGKLVRVVREKTASTNYKNGFQRAAESCVIKEIDQAYLTLFINEIAKFVQITSQNDYKQIACREHIARFLLAKQEWDVPVLSGIINTPTLRNDGSILDEPGYDTQSGLLFIPDHCNFGKIPTNPHKDDAIKATEKLHHILEGFPFENEISRSVAFAAILTALVRKSIATAPLFGFSAPKMASGKSLLADVVSLIAIGKPNSVIAQAENEAEEKKRILGILMEGDQIICFDNIEKPFGGPTLCTILTQREYKDRKLGGNESRTVPTQVTVLVTGNNLSFIGDTSTRALLCKLDPKVERPEEREFKVNLHTFIPQHRAELVQAGLTIIRAYHAIGRPPQGLAPYGRFEEWSDLIRSALVWLGMADPCESRKDIEDADPIRIQLGSLFFCWHEIFGSNPIKIKDILFTIKNTDNILPDNLVLHEQMQETILELAGNNKGEVDARKLAGKLRKYKNRIENGYRLEQREAHQGTIQWAVITIDT